MVYVKKFKATIVNPDRTVSVHYVKNKNKLGASAFKLGKKSDEVYIIDPKYNVLTTTKRMGIPFRYITCYYKRNIPVPIPMDRVHGEKHLKAIIRDDEGQVKDLENIELLVTDGETKELAWGDSPIHMPAFDDWNYNGITAKELGTLFNPQFYQMIARANKNKTLEQLRTIALVNAGASGFIIYYLLQMAPKAIAAAVHKLMGS